MEIRIGVRDVAREVTFESDQTPEAVQDAVTTALSTGQHVLTLTDERGRTIVVPVQALGFIEIGASEKGRVGFGIR